LAKSCGGRTIVAPVRAVFFATLVSCALCPATSRAEAPVSLGMNLDWNAAPGCPDRATAEAAIREILGPRTMTGGPSDLVQVEISRLAEGRWEARVLTRGTSGSGERRFEGPTCNLVADAAVLVAAMMFDPLAIAERIKSMTEASQRAAPSPMPPPTRDRPRMLAGLLAAADVGSLPGPSGGLGVVLGVQYGRWHFEGDATAWLPRLALAPPAQDRGGEIDLYSGGLRACWDGAQSASGELRLGACLAGEAGVTTGQGTTGIAQPQQTSGLWAAAFAGVTARQVSASGLAPWLSLDIGTPVRRPMYVIDSGSSRVFVFQASEIVGRAALGVAWIFP
jgi:hypothetical protein